jgi:hypothetical protein
VATPGELAGDLSQKPDEAPCPAALPDGDGSEIGSRAYAGRSRRSASVTVSLARARRGTREGATGKAQGRFTHMHVRVVRFEGVSGERINAMLERIKESGGPPEGVNSAGITVLYDADQGTAVVLQRYANKQDLEEGARILGAMDASETPGTRTSVDATEEVLDLSA